MGRRAKYFTNIEKQDASRKNKEVYRKSERYVFPSYSHCDYLADSPHSAKALRVQSNRRAYERLREARKCSQPAKLELPPVPSRMRHLACLPVPIDLSCYRRGYRSNTSIEEDEDYAQFLHPPPYTISDELKKVGWSKTGLIVQGKREKALHTLEIKRMSEQYNCMRRQTFRETLHANILRHLNGWHDLCTIMDQARSRDPCEWVAMMGQQVLQWEARQVMNMIEDLEAACNEEDDEKYVYVFLQRWGQ
jgi:hypothetical protein